MPVTKSPTKRPRYPMPDFVRSALHSAVLANTYESRPPYQRNDYIGWIARAKLPETQAKRLAHMRYACRRSDVYMKMAYHPRGPAK